MPSVTFSIKWRHQKYRLEQSFILILEYVGRYGQWIVVDCCTTASRYTARLLAMDEAIDHDEKDFSPVIEVLTESSTSVVEFIVALLTEKRFKKHALTKELLENAKDVIAHILGHRHLQEDAQDMACALVEPMYAHEIRELADSGNWHFGAHQATQDDLDDFRLEAMSMDYEKKVPRLWSLLDALLKARKRKMSLLLQSAPSTVNAGNQAERIDRDEVRLEGNGQQTMSSASMEQDHDTENRREVLSRIVCMLLL